MTLVLYFLCIQCKSGSSILPLFLFTTRWFMCVHVLLHVHTCICDMCVCTRAFHNKCVVHIHTSYYRRIAPPSCAHYVYRYCMSSTPGIHSCATRVQLYCIQYSTGVHECTVVVRSTTTTTVHRYPCFKLFLHINISDEFICSLGTPLCVCSTHDIH